VGAGPGDVGLLTLRARECVARADCIIHDSLVNPIILGWARDDAEIINMGKKGWSTHVSQEEITAVLLQKAREGKIVVRLKGGDPFIFGRGGEEAQRLAEEGIPFEVVPGITSAVAVSAYSGIPLTHRSFVSHVTLLTGHPDSRIQWDTIQPNCGTLVVYMGLANLPHITTMLMKGGWSPETPVALVHRGTFGNQRVLTAPLQYIVDNAKKQSIKTPVLTIIGQVVSLRDHIKWFEQKPLFGRRILVTGSKQQAFQIARNVEELGAVAHLLPTIKVTKPHSWKDLDEALSNLSGFDYIIFPSINSVKFFFYRLKEEDYDIRQLHGIALGAIGENTINELTRRMVKVELPSPQAGLEDFFATIQNKGLRRKRILVPGSKESKGRIATFLKKLGNHVVTANTYRLVDEEIKAHELREAFASPGVDLVIFTCPTSVRNFCSVIRGAPWEKLARELKIAAVGPLTAQAATAAGLNPTIVPPAFTLSSLITEVVNTLAWEQGHFEERAYFLDQATLL
jgi:uroporphyrinogen III methyltransferase/synthase